MNDAGFPEKQKRAVIQNLSQKDDALSRPVNII